MSAINPIHRFTVIKLEATVEKWQVFNHRECKPEFRFRRKRDANEHARYLNERCYDAF